MGLGIGRRRRRRNMGLATGLGTLQSEVCAYFIKGA
jgi:hypothetical protein